MKERYFGRLPGGEITSSRTKRDVSWRGLAREVLQFFPGYKLIAYDPDLIFEKWEKMSDGFYKVLDRMTLSVSACKVLIENAQKKV